MSPWVSPEEEPGRPQRSQDDRKGRPYYTTNRLAKLVYSRDDPCGRSGSLRSLCSLAIALFELALNA